MKIISRVSALVIFVCVLPVLGLSQEKSEDLLGIITVSDLKNEPHATWFKKNDKAYEVDKSSLTNVDALLDGVEIKIAMGTWCHDSKREVPRFYKIISAAGGANVEMIALDRKKQAPGNEIAGMDITNTPTFIFYKNGVELNRIVETPIESLEKDMVKILSGVDYTHSKLLEKNRE